jgi:subtilisin
MANEQRAAEFLVGHTRGPLPAGASPVNLKTLSAAIASDAVPGIKLKRTIGPPPGNVVLGMLASVPDTSHDVLVVEATPDQAVTLQQQPQLIVEPNLPLRFPRDATPTLPILNPSAQRLPGSGFQVTIRIVDQAGAPLQGAEVFVFGNMQNGGVTGNDGKVQVSLFGETEQSIRELYVKPKADHWDRLVTRPALQQNTVYDVTMKPLGPSFPGFPGQQVNGWGLQAIKLDQLIAQGGQFTGQGIKIAIIDSGAAAVTHQDLVGQVDDGFDVVAGTAAGWDNDTLAHGTHCSGVIGALNNGSGIRGIAPQAKLTIFKIFPGGAFDQLILALDKCIQAGVDVVNLSLGADGTSVWVEERLLAAKNKGVACIVAAGNSSGPVQYPASSSNALAVAAIGKSNTFPADSYHAIQIFGQPTAEGYFSAKFSCFGPEIDICAPGVAILSSVPPDNYAAWDGTSMAAPHVTGLAALILAHHPDFQQPPFNERNSKRVDRLFQILKSSAQPLSVGGSDRTGAGLADALKALTQTTPATNGQSSSALNNLLASWP